MKSSILEKGICHRIPIQTRWISDRFAYPAIWRRKPYDKAYFLIVVLPYEGLAQSGFWFLRGFNNKSKTLAQNRVVTVINTYPCLYVSGFNGTVEPRFNEPLFNKILDITNDILCPGKSYSRMYEIESRYNEPRYNEFLDIANIIRKLKRNTYLNITN